MVRCGKNIKRGPNPYLAPSRSEASSSTTPLAPSPAAEKFPQTSNPKQTLKDRRPFQCESTNCRRRFTSPNELAHHQRSHPKPFCCRCSPCTLTFLSVARRNYHEVTALHGEEYNNGRFEPVVQFVCSLCDTYTSATKDGVRRHLKRNHEGADVRETMKDITRLAAPKMRSIGEDEYIRRDPVGCVGCTYTALKEESLRGHISRWHEDLDVDDAMARAAVASTFSVAKKESMIVDDVVVEDALGRITGVSESVVEQGVGSEVLTCYICGFETIKKDNMKRHTVRMHGDQDAGLVFIRIVNKVGAGDMGSDE